MRLLHSLEENQFADLPAKPFIRGFVTSYTRFIGLDPQEVLIRFNDYINAKALDRPSRESGHSGYAFEKREGEQSRTMLWFVMGGFLLVGAVGFVVFKPSLKHHHSSQLDKLKAPQSTDALPVTATSPSPGPSPSDVPLASASASASATATPASEPSPAPSSDPSVVAMQSPVPAKPSKPSKPDPLNNGSGLDKSDIKHKVVIEALDDIWVRYKVDDKPKMRIILRRGRVLVLRASDRAVFQVSNPEQVRFSYNGAAYRGMAGYKSATRHKQDLTLHFQSEPLDKSIDPFATDGTIAGAAVPAPKSNSDLSNSTP